MFHDPISTIDDNPPSPAPIGRDENFSRLALCLPVLLGLLLVACSDDTPAAGDQDATVLDAAGDVEIDFPELLPVPCEEGETMCWEGKLATCMPGGNSWLVESCGYDEICVEGECVSVECNPGERACEDDAVITCRADGTGWSDPQPCAQEETCRSGVCTPDECTPGERMCGPDRVFICEEDGMSWSEELCPEGWTCYEGQCVECIRDVECDPDEICEGGVCQSLDLTVVTDRIPDGMVDQAYQTQLEAVGGSEPYTWSHLSGTLPAGIDLDASGELSGTPTEGGDFLFTVTVTDTEDATSAADLNLRIHAQGLTITTDSLPDGQEGLEYDAQLGALGGTPPYAWMVASGALPLGITLTSAGNLTGIPTEIGDFTATFRVFDNTIPPAFAEKELILTVQIAPLEIIGEQEYDLYLTKVVVLDMLTIIEGVPIPYETQLQARGGMRPYHWTESELVEMLRYLIPNAGIPEGLTLADDGTLSGSVTSADQVISVNIPFSDITLNGFFFMGQVEDSQSPPDTQSALFHIPVFAL